MPYHQHRHVNTKKIIMKNNEYIAIVDSNNEVHLTDTQIVRCRDCIFYDTVHLDCAQRGWADCDRNSFCSYGERKEVKNAIS